MMKSYTFMLKVFIVISLFSFSNFSFSQTDEYGSLNSNRVLTGLGLAASYVSISSQTAFDQNSDGALEMWIYPTALGGSPKTMISKGSNPLGVSFSWMLAATDGKMVFRIGASDFINSSGAAPPLNQWSHVAVSWVGGPNFTVTFYLNGILNGTSVIQSATWAINTDPIRIGGSQAFPSNVFLGDIDEVRFWSVDRSAARIANNRFVGIGDGANSNSSSALTSAYEYSGLISSWTFNSNMGAYDNISNYNGTYNGSATSAVQTLGVPIPYNLALRLGGATTDNIRIPSNSAFNQYTDGTVELWYKPISFSTEQVLLGKGTTTANITYLLGVAPSTGKLYFGLGPNVALNSSGAGLTLNVWNHIAVTWSANGGYFDIKFFLNGKQNGNTSSILINFPFTSDPIWVGSSQPYNLPASGWIDELRIWAPALTEAQIRANMFVSCRAINSSNLVGAWNFDGNLLNFSSTTGVNGTFNNGATNMCRFSGYTNDNTGGAYSSAFIPHTTVINRADVPNSFPNGFGLRAPFVTIPDNNATGITDSIVISGNPQAVTNVEVFLAIQHTYVHDLTIMLTAPNGQTRNLIASNDGAGDNVLSFFGDNFTYLPSSSTYLPPWGFLKPMQAFGNFGGSPAQGTWRLRCIDAISGDIGMLCGWGIRINNAVGIEQQGNEIPVKFSLYQNYPNPFNPSTNVRFDVPGDGQNNVKLEVFDILGRQVDVLVNGEMKPGTYNVSWDAGAFSSGIYFYTLTSGSFTETKKMILMK